MRNLKPHGKLITTCCPTLRNLHHDAAPVGGKERCDEDKEYVVEETREQHRADLQVRESNHAQHADAEENPEYVLQGPNLRAVT